MITTVLAVVVAAALSGALGYVISNKFWSSDYSRTNKTGDFGGPRGGVFAMLGGTLLSMMFVAYVGPLFIPAALSGTVLITVMIAGFVGGLLPMILPLFRSPK